MFEAPSVGHAACQSTGVVGDVAGRPDEDAIDRPIRPYEAAIGRVDVDVGQPVVGLVEDDDGPDLTARGGVELKDRPGLSGGAVDVLLNCWVEPRVDPIAELPVLTGGDHHLVPSCRVVVQPVAVDG